MAVKPGLQAAADKITGLSPQKQARQQGDAKTVLHHGEHRELIDGDVPDIRFQIVLLQNPVNVAAGCIRGSDKRNICKTLHRNLVVHDKRMVRRQHGEQLIFHNGKELIALSFLTADEPDVYPAFLDPVRQFAFISLDHLEVDIRMIPVELPEDLGDPVNGTA